MNRPLSLNSRRYAQHIPNYLAIVDYSSDVNEGSITLDGTDLKDLKAPDATPMDDVMAAMMDTDADPDASADMDTAVDLS